jgi:hypothetical protein
MALWSLTWRSLMGRSARRSMKLKFISTRCFSFDVISMKCTSFVLSVMAINTCYEQCFCLLVNQKPREQPMFWGIISSIFVLFLHAYSSNFHVADCWTHYVGNSMITSEKTWYHVLNINFNAIIPTRGSEPQAKNADIHIQIVELTQETWPVTWYVWNVSIIFDAPCLFYTICFMFCLHFVAFLCDFQN